MQDQASASVRRTIAVLQEFAAQGLEPVVQAAEAIARALAGQRKLLVFGNGGSAADAQHLAAELVNRFQLERPGLPALALTTDASVLTSIANDYHFDEVFSRQVKTLGQEGDVALGISTSGRSPNVLAGLAAARGQGLTTLGLTGSPAGEMAALCDLVLAAPTGETPRVQEVHAVVVHLLCELVDTRLFGRAR
jgi:D-sedoheptulose 7-phosphate isomerase